MDTGHEQAFEPFIAVHVGAGYHSTRKERRYRELCARACRIGMEILRTGTAMDAVEKAVCELENDALTNAGFGSNLTLSGTVECDASIMDGSGYFGALGAVSGVRNPISGSRAILERSRRGLLPLGRVPPIFLAGEAGKEYVGELGADVCHHHELISEEAKKTYELRMQMLHEESEHPQLPGEHDSNHDTVGAICIDRFGHVAAAVSSGGLSLKYPGRVGEAAMYGGGCWAQNWREGFPAIACSTTGTGEQLMKTLFAKSCADSVLQHNAADGDVHRGLETALTAFLHSPALRQDEEKNSGVILLKTESIRGIHRTEFWYAHTTPSMGVGYMSSRSTNPTTLVSRKSNRSYLIWGGLF
ncbi:uncharacterized protein VTP21DRAFT_11255 [Calcarisporiella thermophila]|uniref:uncharacterized protein n=1 Tax=Calcarisporiella thermophila TaxID=911321 RepID=UPI0037446C63